MMSHIKTINDVHFQRYCSRTKSSSSVDKLLSSINAIHRRDCRSENYIHSSKIGSTESFQNLTRDLQQNSSKVVDEQLIIERYPIANVTKEGTVESIEFSSHRPTVPKQADSFLRRLMKGFFSITQSNTVSRQKATKRIDTCLHTRTLSNSSHICCQVLPTRTKAKQRLKNKKTNVNNANFTSSRRPRSLSFKNQDTIAESNNNVSLLKDSKIKSNKQRRITRKQVELFKSSKRRPFDNTQRQKIMAAIETIFDTFLSNY